MPSRDDLTFVLHNNGLLSVGFGIELGYLGKFLPLLVNKWAEPVDGPPAITSKLTVLRQELTRWDSGKQDFLSSSVKRQGAESLESSSMKGILLKSPNDLMSHSLKGCSDSLLLQSVSFEFRSLFMLRDSDFDLTADSSSWYSSMNIEGFVSQRFCCMRGAQSGGEWLESLRNCWYWWPPLPTEFKLLLRDRL